MNKRQKKKFEKKINNKTYYNYRQRKLLLLAEPYINGEPHTDNGINMMYIVDSPRMDLKHPKRVCVLKNVTMSQPNSDTDNKTNEFQLNFSCYNHDHDSVVSKFAEMLKEGLS